MKAEIVAAGNGCEAGWRDGRRHFVDAKASASLNALAAPCGGSTLSRSAQHCPFGHGGEGDGAAMVQMACGSDDPTRGRQVAPDGSRGPSKCEVQSLRRNPKP